MKAIIALGFAGIGLLVVIARQHAFRAGADLRRQRGLGSRRCTRASISRTRT